MDADFWLSRWAENRIGFHAATVNAHLINHVEALGLAPGQCVFVPLCGKTRDIGWLLERGFTVCGVELAPAAVEVLFNELALTPTQHQYGLLTEYRSGALRVFAGDVFALTAELLGPVHAVYDRAALIALPLTMRQAYSRHLIELSSTAPQLLITLEYDQSQLDGPPFSVDTAALTTLYANAYQIKLLEDNDVEGGLKGALPARERVWQLRPI